MYDYYFYLLQFSIKRLLLVQTEASGQFRHLGSFCVCVNFCKFLVFMMLRREHCFNSYYIFFAQGVYIEMGLLQLFCFSWVVFFFPTESNRVFWSWDLDGACLYSLNVVYLLYDGCDRTKLHKGSSKTGKFWMCLLCN